MSWPLIELGKVCEINVGKTPSRHNPEYWGEGAKWLSIKDMSQGALITNTKETITQKAIKETNINLVTEGTVLFSFKLSIGKIGIAQNDLYTNEAIAALPIIDKSILCEEYLVYALSRWEQGITSHRAVMGAALNKAKLLKLKIPLPPLEEQKRIAAILDKADSVRRKRQQAIALADDFLRSVFLDMFGDPVTNPKGWEVKKLGSVLRIRRGASPRPIKDFLGGTVPWIKIGDGSKGDQIYLHDTKEYVTQAGADKSVFLDQGALIFANCGVSLGFARILTKAGCIHDGWLAFDEIDEKFNKIFILKWLNQLTMYFRRIAPDGTQPNLNTTIMKEQEIISPPIDLQRKFERIVYSVDSLLNNVKDGSSQADLHFNAQCQKAFVGEL